jgi:hypothetical protein
VPKGERDLVFGAKIGEPIPAKDAFDADGDIVQIRKDQFKELLRISFDVLMHFRFSGLIQNADIHFSSVQIDTAIVRVLLFVKSHGLASFG